MKNAKKLNVALWTVQILLALFFAGASGAPKFFLPDELLAMPIVLPRAFLVFIGEAGAPSKGSLQKTSISADCAKVSQLRVDVGFATGTAYPRRNRVTARSTVAVSLSSVMVSPSMARSRSSP